MPFPILKITPLGEILPKCDALNVRESFYLTVAEICRLSKFFPRGADEFCEIGLAGIRSTKTHSKNYGARRNKT
jgi:hypothetical protein